jgi:hypothetical protein
LQIGHDAVRSIDASDVQLRDKVILRRHRALCGHMIESLPKSSVVQAMTRATPKSLQEWADWLKN